MADVPHAGLLSIHLVLNNHPDVTSSVVQIMSRHIYNSVVQSRIHLVHRMVCCAGLFKLMCTILVHNQEYIGCIVYSVLCRVIKICICNTVL